MSFWDTVSGHKFAEATIPQLTDALERLCDKAEEIKKVKRKEQYAKLYPASSSWIDSLNEELRNGARVYSVTSVGDDVLVIYEM